MFSCALAICISSLDKCLFKSIKAFNLTCFPPFSFFAWSSFYPPVPPISITHINTVHLCILYPSICTIYVHIYKGFYLIYKKWDTTHILSHLCVNSFFFVVVNDSIIFCGVDLFRHSLEKGIHSLFVYSLL